MRIRNALIVCRKEMLEVRRDRKTLFVTLVLPFLAFPLLIGGLAQYYQFLLESRALREVIIAAEPATQAAWRRLVWEWTKESGDQAAIAGDIAKYGELASFAAIPPQALASPDALAAWARGNALATAQGLARLNIAYVRARATNTPIPQATIERLRRFQQIVIQGTGLILFADPVRLKDAPPSFDSAQIPPEIKPLPGAEKIAWHIQRRLVQGWLSLPEDLKVVTSDDQARREVSMIFDSTIPLSAEAKGRIEAATMVWGQRQVDLRLARRDLSKAFAHPLELKDDLNLASVSKQILALIAGMVPYMVIIFAFMGGMSTATDIGAGEKERGTLETLLLAPVARTEIAAGKFLVVFMTSMMAGLFSVASLGLSLRLAAPAGALEMLEIAVGWRDIAMMGTLAVPMAATFAGMLMTISIHSRSAREAQAMMAPLTFVLLIPGMAAMMEDLEPTRLNSFVPLLNISLLMREFMKGEAWWTCYAIAMVSSFALAIALVALTVRQFKREEVLFRA